MNVIIIPIYNQLELVKKCVDSILKNISNNEFVILVDDCSDKETMEWIEGIINYRNIFGIINESNKGFTYSVNEGIRRAIALCENLFKKELEYICLLNSDTIIGTEDWFNKVIVAINSKKDVGICGVLSNNALHHSIPDIFYEYPKGYNIKSYSKLIEQESEQKNPYCPIVHGFCFIFKKEVLEKIGLFDEEIFPHYGSEDDYCIRALKEGFRTIVCDNVFVHHENCKSYTEEKRSKIVKITIPKIKEIYEEQYVMDLCIKSGNCLDYLKEKVRKKLDMKENKEQKARYYSIGLIIPIYNRPKYLKQCLESIKNSYLPSYITILLIDDTSCNLETQRLFDSFYIDGVNVSKKRILSNKGISKVLKIGYDYFYEKDYEIIMHLESDAIVDKMWLINMLELYDVNKDNIISGFNVGNCNQSKIINENDIYLERDFIGGLNIMLNRKNYDIINQALTEGKDNWDGKLAEIMKEKGMSFVCTKPSMVQHIGIESSDNINHKAFYQATDFNNEIEII